jgi:hypothetical protein
MASTERKRQAVLIVLAAVLAAVLYRLLSPGTSAAPTAASNQNRDTAAPAARPSGSAAQAKGTTAQNGITAPDVHLEALNSEWPKMGEADRNLFRFKPKAPPPPPPAPPRPTQPAMPVNPVPQGPPQPPPLPPITLKFIGIIESPTTSRKIAVFSDGRNPPFQGEEGAIIEGRYRILKIGVESVEMAYTDGRGRQTIRLTGS